MKNQLKTTKKVLINNAVPLNCGDAALLTALYTQLKQKGYQIQIATHNYTASKKAYPNLPFVKELLSHKLFIKLPFLKKHFLHIAFHFSDAYKNADVIIGCPGGYINSFYNIKSSLASYKIAHKKGKKTAIYAQSVGPLNSEDSLWFTETLKNNLDFILVRDQVSTNTLKSLKIDTNKYLQTKDAAFLLPYNIEKNTQTNKIAISVREWSFENKNQQDFIEMIQKMTLYICNDLNKDVEFISTCQGLETYKDDSILALKIKSRLPQNIQNRVTVNQDFHTLNELSSLFKNFDWVIGTRLHMCILSLLQGVPAFNISYEIKGKECYNYLKLAEYSIDYNESTHNALNQLKNFANNQQVITDKLTTTIPKIHKEVLNDFDLFNNKMFY